MVETSANHTERRSIHQQTQRVRLLFSQLRTPQLGHERDVRNASATPPRRHQHRRPATRIQALHRLVPQHRTHRNIKAHSQILRGGTRAGIGNLAGERPRGVSIRQCAHSRRMRHIDCFALLPLQNTGPA